MTAVSTGHRCRFHSVCTNISLEDAGAGAGDHVCGQTRLCCVKVTTFYPGSAGLGWAGRVRCGLLHPDLTPAKPRRAATKQPPATSQDFSRVREFFRVTLRQQQPARMLGPNQVKLPSLENKTPHCFSLPSWRGCIYWCLKRGK